MTVLKRRVLVLLIMGLLLGGAGLFAVGEILSHPDAHAVGPAPADLHAQTVTIPFASGESVVGWFARGREHGGAVLLLHGVHSDRRSLVERARFLEAAGYAVLMIDLPAHGESSGEHITFGAHESLGVNAALGWLRQQLPGERIGVIGFSLGAASLVLAHPSPAPDAVVLESMFPTIKEAVADRIQMRLGRPGRLLAPLLLWQLPLRLGVSTDALRPIDALRDLHAPLLIAAGTQDQDTHWDETERIFAAANQPKTLWRVEGAAHVDLMNYAPLTYQTKVLAFLDQYLRVPAASTSYAVN